MLRCIHTIAVIVYKRLHLNRNKTIGMCAIASVEIFKELRAVDIEARIHRVQGGAEWGHCFVVVDVERKPYTVDITYTQFDRFAPEILIEPYELYKDRLHEGPIDIGPYTEKQTKCIKHFRRYYLSGWPEEQKPTFSLKSA